MATAYAKCGTPFLVDDEDLKLISGWTWRINKSGYVRRKTTTITNGRTITIISVLHRFLCGAQRNQLVDHINGNVLDNRRENLRLATNSQNAMNRSKPSFQQGGRATNSQFKGVTRSKTAGRWQARIGANGKIFYLGQFDDEHAAGHAYNCAAIRLHKEFACLNPVGHASTKEQQP